MLVDGVVVTGYYAVGDYEVSDWKIAQGAHLAESDAPFGVISIGYTDGDLIRLPWRHEARGHQPAVSL